MKPEIDTFEVFDKTVEFWDSPYRTELDFDPFPEVTWENSPIQVGLKLINEIIGVAESPLKTFQRVNELEAGASYRR